MVTLSVRDGVVDIADWLPQRGYELSSSFLPVIEAGNPKSSVSLMATAGQETQFWTTGPSGGLSNLLVLPDRMGYLKLAFLSFKKIVYFIGL